MKTKQTKDKSAMFFKAAVKGDTARLKALIEKGQKVDARDDSGKTALMRASERGHIEAASTLLASGADAKASVTDRDSIWFGCNAVIFAAQGGFVELVELLINAGAPPIGEASDGNTPLSFAVEHQSPRMVEALLKAEALVTEAMLVTSVWSASANVTRLLIAAGANASACDDLGQSVLHRAAEKGHLEIVRALIRAKAKLNHEANGCTPLLIAVQNGHTECALELIAAEADLSCTGLSRRDALMSAAATGQTAVVCALMKAGANPNTKDKEGKTALMLANEKEHRAVVEILREQGADESGYQLQQYIRAAMNGDVRRVREFLASGVDVNAPYSNGGTALISAVRNGHTEVVRLLLEWGANPLIISTAKAWGAEFHADALGLAAEGGHLEIVRLLIKAGADVKKSRTFGLSALNAAAMEGHAAVIRELLKAGCSVRGSDALEALSCTVRRKEEDAALVLVEAGVKPRGREAANLLVSAADNGLLRLVKALLAAGVDPKLRNEYDQTALQAAKTAGHKAIVALLEKAKSPQASPGLELVESAERGDLKTVHRLILEGVDLEARDAKGATALVRASANGHLAVMKILLSAGANPNASTHFQKRDKAKWFHHMDLTSETPLSAAVSAQCLPALEMLLSAGADIRKTECGHLACMILQEGTEEAAALVERLLDAGMDPDARWPETDVSALEIAAQKGFTSLVRKLIRAGARLKTPLERDRAVVDAIQEEQTDTARLLIEQGTATRVKRPITPGALVTAAAAGLDEIVQLLLDRGVKIERRIDTNFEGEGSVDGVTALMAAARHGRISTVEILLSAGANPNTQDALGRTALDWAQDNKSKNLAKRICHMLKAAGAKG